MKNKLVLIDGYGFLFRAYFAIKSLRRSDGLSVNGVYGFTKMLMDLMVNVNASHIAIVFDTGKKTFRHNIYTQYKANRPPVPEDLIPQFPIVRDVAKALNIKILEKVGYEADDIIATVATKAEKENFEVLIVSSDKDLMQLVNENISIYDAMKDKKVHIEDVIEKWGVEPVKVLDVLSLIGDTSDNVPGVPSIGPKTATELIKEFGSVENLIDNLDKIKQEKRRNAIIENLENLKLSKTLITLEKNVDLEETLDDLLVQKIEPEKLIKFLDSMEFYSISKKMRELYNLHNSQENDLFIENNKSNFFEYKKITNIEQLKKCLENITDKLYIDLITEQYEEYDDIKSISLIDDKNMYICYIPLEKEEIDLFGNTNTDCLSASVLFNNLKYLLENKNILKISHNIKKIIRICKKYNVDLNSYDDIGVISYILDSGKFNHNLPNLIEQYLYNNVEIKIKNVELNNKILITYEKNKEITKITGDLFNISCFKLETIYFLHKILYDRLKNSEQKNVYYKIEQPLIKILANMEYEGIEVDVAELKALSIYFFQKTSDIEASIFQEVGYEFNIGSPKQLGEVLFEKLGFPHKNKKTGSYTTDNEVLEDLASKGYEIADKIIEWRQFSKLKSTYSDVLVKLMDKNHRVHTTFLNTNVVTGRLSSINPNIQNIPIKTEEGVKIRKTFIAKDGYKLIGADYSQIELRILAHYANVSSLIKSFNENIDVHTETAKKIFKTEEITSEMRRQAKIINFSIIYGTTSYGLAKRLNSNKKTADIYMRDYFFLYPEITAYMFDIVKFAESNGYTKTLFGRKCHIDLSPNIKGIRRQFTERLAINSPIQGSGADIIKMATIDLYNKLKGLDAKILLQIHDELVIEAKENIVDEVSEIVKNSMENIVKLSVPLPVEVKVGNNWGEIH